MYRCKFNQRCLASYGSIIHQRISVLSSSSRYLGTGQPLSHTSSPARREPSESVSLRSSDWKYKHGEDKWDKVKLGGLLGIIGVASTGLVSHVLCEEQRDEDRIPDVKRQTDTEQLIDEDKGGFVLGYNKLTTDDNISRRQAIEKAKEILKRRMDEVGAPGLSIHVSVDGEDVWADGLGYADVENRLPCSPTTVMRIASISKSLTMTSVAQLWEQGKIDLDAPIQKYLPNFPSKKVDGEEVTITTRQLLSHQSGIRHYKLKDPNASNKETDEKNTKKESGETNTKVSSNKDEGTVTSSGSDDDLDKVSIPQEDKDYLKLKKRKLRGILNKARVKKREKKEESEFDLKEYYIKEKFDTIEEALMIFEDDELLFKPGTDFLYTTHGWTVVSGIAEVAAGKPFTKIMTRLFHDLGLENTYFDKHEPIIYNRARYYIRDKNGCLKNAPYVDNSYKWAGGGFLSTVTDLVKFGNAMLFASQHQIDDSSEYKPGFLKNSTMKMLWTPTPGTKMGWDIDGAYALGWAAVENKQHYSYCHKSRHYVSHTGGAIGASSVLLVMPTTNSNTNNPPKGVVVAIITNMQGVGLNKVAMQIAKLFEKIV